MFKGLHLFNQVLFSVLLPALSFSLFELLLSATLSFFPHLVQITICSGSWSGDLACKAARPVPALGPGMVMVVHGLPSSEVMRLDKFNSRVKRRAVGERGVHKQSGARLSVSLRCLIRGGGPVRQHEIKLSNCCRLYTTVRLERDKHCLGGRVCACGQNGGL